MYELGAKAQALPCLPASLAVSRYRATGEIDGPREKKFEGTPLGPPHKIFEVDPHTFLCDVRCTMGANRNLKELTGQVFGNLTVLRRAGSEKRRCATWLCRCTCGQEVVVRSDRLRGGRKKSCSVNGHWYTGWIEDRGLVRSSAFPSERRSWESMKKRCYQKNHAKYPMYGGVGITVCDRWRKSFRAFIEDMGPKPTPMHTIDRYPNQAGNYEPGNCRWATHSEQAANRKNNIKVVYEGREVLLLDLVRELGINRGVVYGRLKLGWSLADALTTPVAKRGRPPQLDPLVRANKSEYKTWISLKRKCLDPTHHQFYWYGGRGVQFAEEWRDDFAQFLADVGKRPEGPFDLSWIDPDKGFVPGNTEWRLD